MECDISPINLSPSSELAATTQKGAARQINPAPLLKWFPLLRRNRRNLVHRPAPAAARKIAATIRCAVEVAREVPDHACVRICSVVAAGETMQHDFVSVGVYSVGRPAAVGSA